MTFTTTTPIASSESSQETLYWQIVEELEINGWNPGFDPIPDCIKLQSTSQNNPIFPEVSLPLYWSGGIWSDKLREYLKDGELTLE